MSTRHTIALGVLAALTVGCGNEGSTVSPAATSQATTTVTASPVATDAVLPTTTAAATTTTIAAAAKLEVTGGDLPPGNDGIGYQQLLADYHTPPSMAYVAGPGAVVISVQQMIDNISAEGGFRFDAVVWAFVDPRTDAELVDAYAAATGHQLSAGEPHTTGVGSTCVEGTSTDMMTPEVIACTSQDGTHTMQIMLNEWSPIAPVPPAAIEPYIAANAAALPSLGAPTSWNVIRDSGQPNGHAIIIGYGPAGVTDAQIAALPGWSPVGDSGYGESWTDGTSWWTHTDSGPTWHNTDLDSI